MNVLVTGGAGFIGSNVVDAYVAEGHRVAVVDNLCHGRRENLNPAASFYEVDICDPTLEAVLAKERPQLVCHHAAHIDVVNSVAHPEEDLQANVIGIVRLASACVRHGVETIVFASSGGAIYGEPERNPVSEATPNRPLSPYGIDKLTGELYLQFYEATYGLKVRILRYANVYGPRQIPMGEGAVVAIFTRLMLEGKRPRIFGDGNQLRDFVYAGDVARACLLAPNAPNSDPINIGTGQLISINDLYAVLAESTGFAEPPIYAPARPGEVYALSLDATRAKERLGWEPQVSLEEGLRRVIEQTRREAALA